MSFAEAYINAVKPASSVLCPVVAEALLGLLLPKQQQQQFGGATVAVDNGIYGLWVSDFVFVDLAVSKQLTRHLDEFAFVERWPMRSDPTLALERINALVRSITGVQNALAAAQLADRMLVLSVVQFRGFKWRSQFNPLNTQIRAFTRSDGNTQQLPLMRQTAELAVNIERQFVRLYFNHPHDSVTQLYADFCLGESMPEGEPALETRRCELSLPRFHYNGFVVNLLPLLQQHGCSVPDRAMQLLYVKVAEHGLAGEVNSEPHIEEEDPNGLIFVLRFDQPFRYRVCCNELVVLEGFFNGVSE